MATRHLTLRLNEELLESLDSQSRHSGQSRSELARTLIEEGLRMEMHPGIVFRPGPAGRRPGLASGPDVWEIVRVFSELGAADEDALRWTVESSGLSEDQVKTALRYYADYPEEIDEWITRNDEEAKKAEEAWLREKRLLGR